MFAGGLEPAGKAKWLRKQAGGAGTQSRRHGFETAVKGKNGFVCIVGRSWTSAADADFT